MLFYSQTPFHLLPLDERERIIKSWSSPHTYLLFPPIRVFALQIIKITKAIWLRKCSDIVYPAIEYQLGTSDAWKGKDFSEFGKEGEGKGFYSEFEFIDVPHATQDEDEAPFQIETDVVIVGSGCGGAVAAKNIAEAGLNVVVVEKGIWVPTDQLPLLEDEAGNKLYEGCQYLTNANGTASLLAGSTFGGGGVVNWGASLQTQHYVLEDWATNHNLPFFLSGDFQACLDCVCSRMGVASEGIVHSHPNSTLLEGARKLGYAAKVVPQNALPSHQDAYCHLGCGGAPGARKMGTTQTFLPDAARAGARFMTGFSCSQILFTDSLKTQACGIEGVVTKSGQQVKILAKHVVISGGSLNTPTILLRSGLSNPQIGRSLHLHPVLVMSGTFKERTNPLEGSSSTSIVTAFENLDHNGHGAKLEALTSAGPLIGLASKPWLGGQGWKQSILEFQHTSSFVVFIRDKNTGVVSIDGNTDKMRIDYDIGREERDWIITAFEGLAKILYVQGVEEITVPIPGIPPFIRAQSSSIGNFSDSETEQGVLELDDPGIMDPAFVHWLALLRNTGLSYTGTTIGSAHQMGSCRMSAQPSRGVVDPKGQVWGVKGLSISDASVMPSACGVNPMVTTMALSDWISRRAVELVKGLS